MKKVYISLFLIVSILIFSACKDSQDQLKADEELDKLIIAEIDRINTESHLGMEFFAPSKLSDAEASRYGTDHPETIQTDDNYVEGYFFTYPYESSERRLTQILIEGGEYDLLGIRVGDDISMVKPIVTELNYKQEEPLYIYAGTATESYILNHIHFTFETDKDSSRIKSILLSIYDPDEPDIVE